MLSRKMSLSLVGSLRQIINGIENVHAGDGLNKIEVKSNITEFSHLVDGINTMLIELVQRDKQILLSEERCIL